jgi:hypothetical protein
MAVTLACAVCGGQDAVNSQAYVDTMIFLTLLPLGLMGTAGYVVWRLHQFAEHPEAAPEVRP